MKEEPVRLFVYGTLRVGRSNYRAIARFVLNVEPATVDGVLVNLGSFPALVPGPRPGIVEGEVLTIKPDGLEITDRIEGVNHGFYERRMIEARLESGTVVQAWTYFYAAPEKIADYPRLLIDQKPV